MPAQKILALDDTSGLPREIAPAAASTGSADAGRPVALNGAGQLDSSMMPPGVGGALALLLPATEDIAAGAPVNIWNSSGTPSMRNASAADATKPAHGFVNAAVAQGSQGTMYGPGELVTGLSGLTPGQRMWLGTTAGTFAAAAPTDSGTLAQPVGAAASADTLLFMPGPGVIRA